MAINVFFLGYKLVFKNMNDDFERNFIFNLEMQNKESRVQSPKFKRVLLNETPEFPFWGLNICVDFDLGDFKIMENMKKLNKIIFHNKNIYIHKTA